MDSKQKPIVVASAPDPAGRNERPLENWLAEELKVAWRRMAVCISATELTKERSVFDQAITPICGSVVAAPMAKDDELPDYFFHWLRDSALVMDAFGLLAGRTLEPAIGAAALNDFVTFSSGLNRLSGGAMIEKGRIGRSTDPKLRQFLRDASELAAVEGDRLFGEVRFNPDSTLDILKWSRPQFDGPALRALTILRWMHVIESNGPVQAQAARALVFEDLDFLLRHFHEPCYDLWEARFGHHYHTRLVILAAFKQGAHWASRLGSMHKARAYHAAVATLTQQLDQHWSQKQGFYLAAIEAPGSPDSNFDLDAAVLLAVLHSRNRGPRHSIIDPRVQATILKLQHLFEQELPINHARKGHVDPQRGILFGRFKGDSYYGGGAFVMVSLAAAEFYYHLADVVACGVKIPVTAENGAFLENCGIRLDASVLSARNSQIPRSESEKVEIASTFFAMGDAVMNAFRRFVPESGELAEQMDKETGAPRSANNLAWSYAAFIRAFEARSRCGVP